MACAGPHCLVQRRRKISIIKGRRRKTKQGARDLLAMAVEKPDIWNESKVIARGKPGLRRARTGKINECFVTIDIDTPEDDAAVFRLLRIGTEKTVRDHLAVAAGG